MATVLRLLVLGLLLACSDTPSPVAIVDLPPPDAMAEGASMTATWVLVKVNGQPLPTASPIGAGDWDYGGVAYQLVGASLTFTPDGTYSSAWKHQQVVDGVASNDLVDQVFVGTYSVDGSTVRFSRPGGTSTASITPTALIWDFSEKFVLKFKR
jgi:hypothetical protein